MTILELPRGEIELEGKVRATEETFGVTVAVIEPPANDRPNRVLGIDETGTVLWEIRGGEGEFSGEPDTVTDTTTEFVKIIDDEGWTYLVTSRHGDLCRVVYEVDIGNDPVKFAHPIQNRIEYADIVLIHLAIEPGTPSRNIFAFDSSGSKLWQIEGVERSETDGYSTYTGIEVKDGSLVAWTYNSWKVSVDPADGSVTKEQRVK